VAEPDDQVKVLLRNKRARHDYFVEDTVEAGLVLQGSEVKSLREARAVLSDAYVQVRRGEAWLSQMSITEWPFASHFNHPPKRERKLLLHRREIDKLDAAVAQKGYTILPLEVYLKRGRIKVLLGVCRGKKLYDKRQDARRRDAEREVESALKRR
jgi:SsrA-binding protein